MNENAVESTPQGGGVMEGVKTSVRAAFSDAGASGGNWRTALPEAWADRLKDVAGPDDAMAALERGLAYHPARSVDEIRLEWPEDFSGRVDENVQRGFCELCVREGITPPQAQALLDWQIHANRQALEEVAEAGVKALRRSWGTRFERNRGEALRAFSALDRRMGGELSASAAGRGMANDPVFVRAFYEIGRLLSEDGLSAGTVPSARVMRESAEETYNGMFKGE